MGGGASKQGVHCSHLLPNIYLISVPQPAPQAPEALCLLGSPTVLPLSSCAWSVQPAEPNGFVLAWAHAEQWGK